MATARGGETKQLARDLNAIETVGELFSDGHQIEILADPVDCSRLRLLYWDGHSAKVGSLFERDGHIYRAAAVSRSFLQVTHLPVRQGRRVEAAELFPKISSEFRQRLGLPSDDADRVTFYCLSTWFADILPILPTLWIAGADATDGIQVLRLIACFCRRPLLLGAIARGAWSLVADTRPTLLLFDAGASAGIGAGLQASNYRGLLSLDGRGVHSFSFSKAEFTLATAVDPSLVESGVLHVSLGAERAQALGLPDYEFKKVSDEFQPILLTYRLANCERVRESQFDVAEFTFPTRATAAALGSCVGGEPGLTARLIALLRWQDNAARAERCIDPHSSLVEVLLGLAHRAVGTNAPQTVSVAVQEIAHLLNALVRSRGGIQYNSAEEVGWMLRKLGISKTRSAAGMQVSLCDETARRVHSMARMYGVSLIESHGLKCRQCEGAAPGVGV